MTGPCPTCGTTLVGAYGTNTDGDSLFLPVTVCPHCPFISGDVTVPDPDDPDRVYSLEPDGGIYVNDKFTTTPYSVGNPQWRDRLDDMGLGANADQIVAAVEARNQWNGRRDATL